MTDENQNTPVGMKPFNLESALAGAPVVMRNGRKVLEVLTPKSIKNKEQPVVCVNIKESITMHCTNGSYYYSSVKPHEYDLFMLPQTKTFWVNVYKTHGAYATGGAHESIEEAQSTVIGNDYVKTISFEVEL